MERHVWNLKRQNGSNFNISSEERWKRKDYSKISSLNNRVNMIADNWDKKQKSNNNNKKQVLKGWYETWRVIVNPMIHPKFKKGLKNQYLRDTKTIFETPELHDITQEDHVKWEKIAVPLENSSRRDETRRKRKKRQKHNGKNKT